MEVPWPLTPCPPPMSRVGGRRSLGATKAGDDGASPSSRMAGSREASVEDEVKHHESAEDHRGQDAVVAEPAAVRIAA